MGDRNLRIEDFGRVDLCGRNPLAETSDFTDFLEEKDLPRIISIDADASRVVTTIFLAGETIAEDFTNLLAILGSKIAAVAEDSAHGEWI
jgi:hypothetical protein